MSCDLAGFSVAEAMEDMLGGMEKAPQGGEH